MDLVMLNFRNIYWKKGLNGGGRSWIRECISNEIQFPKFNSIMEMCSGPGFMGYHLAMKYGINDIHLVDIYEPNREVIEKTNSENNLDAKFYLSDTFDNYDGPMVDFICSNPPHIPYVPEEYHGDEATPRILIDEDLQFHKKFFNGLDKHLKVGGYLFLLENENYIPLSLIYSMCDRLELKKRWFWNNNSGLYSALLKYHSTSFENQIENLI